MSDPIRISSCRPAGDVRCPVCGLMQAGAEPGPLLPCGCRVCAWSIPCLWRHLSDLLAEAIRQRDAVTTVCGEACGRAEELREERDAALKQVEEQRHPCPCGKDTASIKWARCYSCRQADAEALDAAKAKAEKATGLLRRVYDLCAPGGWLPPDVLTKIRELLSEKGTPDAK